MEQDGDKKRRLLAALQADQRRPFEQGIQAVDRTVEKACRQRVQVVQLGMAIRI